MTNALKMAVKGSQAPGRYADTQTGLEPYANPVHGSARAMPGVGSRTRFGLFGGLRGKSGIKDFANEAVATLVAVLPEAVSASYAELANEGSEQWVLIAPYGRWAHDQGMQVFERADAEALAREYAQHANEAVGRLGLPWYIGHPDHPRFKDRYRDTRAYGRVKELRAGSLGLEGRTRFSGPGRQIIANEEFHGHSPNWSVRRDVKTGAWRPFRLKSVGWTNEPNLPVPPVLFANENEGGPMKENKPMWKKLMALFGLKADATEQEVVEAAESLANEKADLEAKLQTAETCVTKVTGERDAANERVTDLERVKGEQETALANERNARASVMADFLVATNKLPAAKRGEIVTELANCKEESALQGRFTELANAAPVLPEGTKTEGLGSRKAEGESGGVSASAEIQELVNERMSTANVDYDTAWRHVRGKRADLFEKLKQPKRSEN